MTLTKFQVTLMGLLLCLSLLLAPPIRAQEPPPDEPADPAIAWRELKTDHFIIVYAKSVAGLNRLTCACGIGQAQVYEKFADEVYEELTGVFGVSLNTPLNLRLFPTEESYYLVNPLARHIPGVIAHALNNQQEIAIALPRTESLSEAEIVNNLRHELTHFFASSLSDGKLKTGFQEGTAQYLEKPTATAAYDPTVLAQALEQGRLLTWAELDDAAQVWREPQVAYPQALSVTAFLIDRYGFEKYLALIAAHAAAPGYRSALETTYGQSPEALEAEWLAYLPAYFAGRWQINALYHFDLSRVDGLVARGAYSAAAAELPPIIDLLQTTGQTETLAEARRLLARAEQGRAAGALADESRRALLAHDYSLAIQRADAALAAYQALGNSTRAEELALYLHRAEQGQAALSQLEAGRLALDNFRFLDAESPVREATTLLQALGNQPAAPRARRCWASFSSAKAGWLTACWQWAGCCC
jgi:hypothetical protein